MSLPSQKEKRKKRNKNEQKNISRSPLLYHVRAKKGNSHKHFGKTRKKMTIFDPREKR